jgi:hypothetical protein
MTPRDCSREFFAGGGWMSGRRSGKSGMRNPLAAIYAQQGRSGEIAALAPAPVSMQTPDFLDPFCCTFAWHQSINGAE